MILSYESSQLFLLSSLFHSIFPDVGSYFSICTFMYLPKPFQSYPTSFFGLILWSVLFLGFLTTQTVFSTFLCVTAYLGHCKLRSFIKFVIGAIPNYFCNFIEFFSLNSIFIVKFWATRQPLNSMIFL